MEEPEARKPNDPLALALRWAVGLVLVVVAATGLWYLYAYVVTPAAIRHPHSAHIHFRLQVIVDGTPVNFAETKFQTPFNKDICTAALTKEPIHFHDSMDQFVHIHWAGMTGGLLLKHYGWNLLGGSGDTLGYRFDQGLKLVRVPIHGVALPRATDGSKFYVYTGTKDSFHERNWQDFLKTDLNTFLPMDPSPMEHDAAKLNDVHESVVIFAQKDKPTGQEVRDRFDHLIPLPTSSCSG